MTDNTIKIKDANDLLKAWVAEGADPAEQGERIKRMLCEAPTVVEEMARWAGGLAGAERDHGIEVVFRMIGSLSRTQRAQYRSRLTDLLGIGIRALS